MKKPKVKLKPFEAWSLVDKRGAGRFVLATTLDAIPVIPSNVEPVRVVVRDARDDSEARLRRENARLRRALRDARDWLDIGVGKRACDIIVKALERRDR